jgi:hypothetical protein
MGEDMNDPITRPVATETGFYDDGRAVSVVGTGHSTSTHIDNSQRRNDALPWVVIAIVATVACSMAGVSLGISIGARDAASIAERESRLQRLEVDELKIALQVQGIKVHEGVSP